MMRRSLGQAYPASNWQKKPETLVARFPNAPVNDDERRRLRAALYRPLLGLNREDRGRIVEAVLAILLNSGSDHANA